jgi:hypothetical protein
MAFLTVLQFHLEHFEAFTMPLVFNERHAMHIDETLVLGLIVVRRIRHDVLHIVLVSPVMPRPEFFRRVGTELRAFQFL